jgi:hypothetical protein
MANNRRECPKLKENHLRGKEYCLDHIIPISYGYENDIEPSIIGVWIILDNKTQRKSN